MKPPAGKAPPAALADVRGAARLAVEATAGVAEVVEAMQAAIGGGPAFLGRPLALPVRLFAGPVYGVIRGVTKVVGTGVDLALAGAGTALAPVLPADAAAAIPAPVVAVLNGVLGDHLAASGNPLAREACLLHEGRVLALEEGAGDPLPGATRKLLVLVHGSCLDQTCWTRDGRDLGATLARDLGFTPVHARYNTGLHVSANGRALATVLERLLAARPGGFDEVALVGHSMGGLVARSACHVGERDGHRWRERLRTLACLGTPHLGAPLERGGHGVDVLLGAMPWTAPLARLGRIRSAGVTDLRHGSVLEDPRGGRERFAAGQPLPPVLPLPAGVSCFAVAGSLSEAGCGKPRGDGLVSVDSALGRHRSDPSRSLDFPEAHRFIAHRTGHMELLGHAPVFEQLRAWLSAP